VRTTLTIDDDVAAQLERLRCKRNASLEDIIDEALRRGLRDMAMASKRREPFRTRSADVGEMLVPDVDNAAEVLALIEGDPLK
jgi:Ribbon-helix-helix protein, copG family